MRQEFLILNEADEAIQAAYQTLLKHPPKTPAGYQTGRIEFPCTGIEVNLLPNQFYRCHREVKRFPISPGKGFEGRGLTNFKITPEGTVLVDSYYVKQESPLDHLLTQAHEEGHALMFFGRLTEIVAAGIAHSYRKTLSILDGDSAQEWDKIALSIAINCGGKAPGHEVTQNAFLEFLSEHGGPDELPSAVAQMVAGLRGRYAEPELVFRIAEKMDIEPGMLAPAGHIMG